MGDPTEVVELSRSLLEELQRSRPGVPVAEVLEEAVRRTVACRHELVECSACGVGWERERWFSRELRRRRWRNRVLSEFYAEIHEALVEVVRRGVDNSAAQAAQAVHGVARRHRLGAARQLVPPAAMSRAEHVDLALGRFYREVISALGRHASSPKATAHGAPLVVKRVALAAGVTAVEQVAMPRLTRTQLEARNQSRRVVKQWDEDDTAEVLSAPGPAYRDEHLREMEHLDEQMRRTEVTIFKPSLLCPRPEDHEEAALAAIARCAEAGHGPAETVEVLSEAGYAPPVGKHRWTAELVGSLRDRALALVGRRPGPAADLPTLGYVELLEALVPAEQLARWVELGQGLHGRPGWRFRLTEEGWAQWSHLRRRLWVTVEGERFTLWRSGRDVDDAAAWEFKDLGELLGELGHHERGRSRFGSRCWGSGRWGLPAAPAAASG